MAPSSAFLLQSIVVDEGRVQLSWTDPASAGPLGTEVRTALIATVGSGLDTELGELSDAAEQLLVAWEGARRERALR